MANRTLRLFEPGDALHFPEFAALGILPELVPQPAFTAVSDGMPVACAGLVVLRTGIAEAWFIARRPLNGDGLYVARLVRDFLDDVMSQGRFRRIQATAAVSQPERVRFLEFLGFQREATLEAYGLKGEDHYLYARVRRDVP